jgi:hypothetical protein
LYSSTHSSATGALKSSTRSTRRDSHDTFYSSDEDESPLSHVHHAHTNEGTGDREEKISSSDEGSSSEEDEREGGRSKVKGGREGRVNNERGAEDGKSESESESESSSSSEEEEEGERKGGLGGGGKKKLPMGQSRNKEKVK